MRYTFTLLCCLVSATCFCQQAANIPDTSAKPAVAPDSVAKAGKLVQSLAGNSFNQQNLRTLRATLGSRPVTDSPAVLNIYIRKNIYPAGIGNQYRHRPGNGTSQLNVSLLNVPVAGSHTITAFNQSAADNRKQLVKQSIGLSLVGLAAAMANASQASNNNLPLLVMPWQLARFR